MRVKLASAWMSNAQKAEQANKVSHTEFLSLSGFIPRTLPLKSERPR